MQSQSPNTEAIDSWYPRPKTVAPEEVSRCGGERFSEQVSDRRWAEKEQSTDGMPTPVGSKDIESGGSRVEGRLPPS